MEDHDTSTDGRGLTTLGFSASDEEGHGGEAASPQALVDRS